MWALGTGHRRPDLAPALVERHSRRHPVPAMSLRGTGRGLVPGTCKVRPSRPLRQAEAPRLRAGERRSHRSSTRNSRGQGRTRLATGRGPSARCHPSGSPELQIQGRGQTRQVQQCVEHLHGRTRVHQPRQKRHELRGEGRAVPGQELRGPEWRLSGNREGPRGARGPAAGPSAWSPRVTAGESASGPDGQGAGPPNFPWATSICFLSLFCCCVHFRTSDESNRFPPVIVFPRTEALRLQVNS